LSASGKDSIEEGTVAALIAIALEGKSSNAVEKDPEEYLLHPEIPQIDFTFYSLSEKDLQVSEFILMKVLAQKQPAGAAGKGPKPPNPPSAKSSYDADTGSGGGVHEEEIVANEADGSLEEEAMAVDSIMMFAKMDLPEGFNKPSTVVEDEEEEDDEIEVGDESPTLLPNVEERRTQSAGSNQSRSTPRKTVTA